MKSAIRLVRSVLYTPCDRWNVMEKVIGISPDVIIFDLEDAVSPQNKEIGRENIIKFMKEKAKLIHSKIVVRINCRKTSIWGYEDIQAIKFLPIDGIVLPKVDSIHNLVFSCEQIGSKIPIWCMLETAKAIQNVDEITQHNQVEALILGLNDLGKDINARSVSSRIPMLYSMSKSIIAAKSMNKLVIDGVFMNLKDNEGLRQECIQGRDLGFDGKTLIHPNQIDIVHEIYSPSEEDIQYSKRVISVYNESIASGKSLAVLDGKLIENLHVEQARTILEKWNAIESRKEKINKQINKGGID